MIWRWRLGRFRAVQLIQLLKQFLRSSKFVPAASIRSMPRLLLALNVPFRELQQEPGLEVFAQEVKAMAVGSWINRFLQFASTVAANLCQAVFQMVFYVDLAALQLRSGAERAYCTVFCRLALRLTGFQRDTKQQRQTDYTHVHTYIHLYVYVYLYMYIHI